MVPRCAGQTSVFVGVFFVFKFFGGIEGQKKLNKFTISS